MDKLKRIIARYLLMIVSRWENKLWRYCYAKSRKYCACPPKQETKSNHCVVNDDKDYT